MEEIVNRVAGSGLVSVELDQYKPKLPIAEIDLADQLWQGLALREKDFRTWIKETDWKAYNGVQVCIYCSADAIIPGWAFMLLTSVLHGHGAQTFLGQGDSAIIHFWKQNLQAIDPELFANQRLVVKGCGDESIPHELYTTFIQQFQDVAQSIMYGEPCSTVPIYKRPKAQR